MRKAKNNNSCELSYKVMVLDDEMGILEGIKVYFKRSYPNLVVEYYENPLIAIEKLKNDDYDLLITDYMMEIMNGDEVVRQVRKANKDTYILLLTGHSNLAPPFETMRNLDIQAYADKRDFELLMIMVQSAFKSVDQKRYVKQQNYMLSKIINFFPAIFTYDDINISIDEILNSAKELFKAEDVFMIADDILSINLVHKRSVFKGYGKYSSYAISDILCDIQFILIVKSLKDEKRICSTDTGIVIPILVNDEVSGVFCIENSSLDLEMHMTVINTFVMQIGSFLMNYYHKKCSEIEKSKQSDVLKSFPSIFDINSLEVVINKLIEVSIKFFETDNIFIWIDDKERPLSQNIGSIYKGNGSYTDINFIDNKLKKYLNETKFQGKMKIDLNEIILPLSNSNKSGVLYAQGNFLKFSQQILNIYSFVVSTAIDLASERKAKVTDHLTGLYNEHFLNEFLLDYHEDIIVDGQASVLYLDIDNFKRINDTFGHDIGDEFIKLLGNVLKSCVRHTDSVIRLHGDEFLVYLPESTLEGAKNVAQKILDRLKTISYKEVAHFLPNAEFFKEYPLSTSIGISYCNAKLSLDILKNNADKAMYLSKKNGKGCYTVFKE